MAKKIRAKGEGTLRRRDPKKDYWEGRLVIGKDADGKPIRKSFYGKKTEVVTAMREYQTLYIGNANAEYTFAAWSDVWLETYNKPTVKVSTYDRNKKLIKRCYLAAPFAGLKLRNIQVVQLQQQLNQLGEHYSHSTMINIKSLLSAILKKAYLLGYAPNLYEYLELPKGKVAKERRVLTNEEYEKLAAHLIDNYSLNNMMILTLMLTGLRIGEALGLTWSDMDLEQGTLTVRRTIVRVAVEGEETKTRLIEQTPKTKTSARTVPLPDVLVGILKQHRQQQIELRFQLGHGLASRNIEELYVFARETGVAKSHGTMFEHLRKVTRAAGVADVNLHGLRHSFVSYLLNQENSNSKAVASIVGHSNTRVTDDVYYTVSDETKRKIMSNIKNWGTTGVKA